MQYEIYKLKFPYGAHFGDRVLERSQINFHADTLFSALCIEALRDGEEKLSRLCDAVNNGKLIFSDGFPFCDKELYLPKPYIKISHTDGDSTLKKKYKNLKYVPMSSLNDYLAGSYSFESEADFGRFDTITHASVTGLEDTLPYRVSVFRFNDNCGLYIIYGYENDETKDMFYELLDGLSFSGLGGKRSSGLGRFEIYTGALPDSIAPLIMSEKDSYILLSTALPKDDEMEIAVHDASYMLKKRSGFVESASYSDEFMRKRDLYMFSSGSVFKTRFTGDIYDVSQGGNHPVYRYGKGLFLGV